MANDRGADIYREMTDWLERFVLHEINLRGDFIAHRDLPASVVASSLSYENDDGSFVVPMFANPTRSFFPPIIAETRRPF